MSSVDEYIESLPEDRRDAVVRLRDIINTNLLPRGYEERFQYDMITWCVPESVMPASEVYNKQPLAFAGLASKKSYMALHLMAVYGHPKERAWLESAFKKAGKKLDMGKGCLRFSKLDELPLDVIGELMSHTPVEKYVEGYRKVRPAKTAKSAPSAKTAKTGKTGKTGKTAKAAKPNSGSGAKKPAKKPAKKSR